MSEDKEKSGNKVKFEIPMPIFAGLISLYLLKQTIADYQEKGPTDIWTIVSGVFFLIAVLSFAKSLRKKSD